MLKVRLVATLLVAAFLSGCAAHESDPTTMAASADNSQLNPLGQANMEMKTLRPQAPSELTVTDVRIGRHEGFERVVFELDGGGAPGWFVDYADTPTQQGSGKTIDHSGETALNVNIDGVVYHFEAGKDDPRIGVVDAPQGRSRYPGGQRRYLRGPLPICHRHDLSQALFRAGAR